MSQLLNKQYYRLIKVAGALLDDDRFGAYVDCNASGTYYTVLHNGTVICMLRATCSCESHHLKSQFRRERRCYGALHSRRSVCYESISQSTAEVPPSWQGCVRHSIPRISSSTRGHAYCKQLRYGLERWTALLAAETVTLCSAFGA